MSAHDLDKRVGKLERTLSAFSSELRLALQYVRHDASSSLTKSRIVLERLVVGIYVVEMERPPRKPLLGEMLADNQFTRKIERRILARMGAIRDMANLGPHGEAVEPSDAARVLDDLCEVLDWYSKRYVVKKTEPAGGDIVDMERVVPAVDPPPEVPDAGDFPIELPGNRLRGFRLAKLACAAGAISLALLHMSASAYGRQQRLNDGPMSLIAGIGAAWIVIALLLLLTRRRGVYVSVVCGAIESLVLLIGMAVSGAHSLERGHFDVGFADVVFGCGGVALLGVTALGPGLVALLSMPCPASNAAPNDELGIRLPDPHANRAAVFRRATLICVAGALALASVHFSVAVNEFDGPAKGLVILAASLGAAWSILAFRLFAARRWAVYASLGFAGLQLLFLLLVIAAAVIKPGPDSRLVASFFGCYLVVVGVAGLGPALYARSKMLKM